MLFAVFAYELPTDNCRECTQLHYINAGFRLHSDVFFVCPVDKLIESLDLFITIGIREVVKQEVDL